MMVRYIWDTDSHHQDISKVTKTVDWPPCVDMTNAWTFMGIHVYYRISIKGFAQVVAFVY